MKTQELSIREYSRLAGYTASSGRVYQKIRENKELEGVVSIRKVGGVNILEVDPEWIKSREGQTH